MNTESNKKVTLISFLKSIFTERRRFDVGYLTALTASILLALAVGAVIMLIVGYNPIECYVEMVNGAFGTQRDFANTIAKASTLCLTGLAMAVAAKAGMFNVGGEGQLFFGAIASAIVGVACAGLPPMLAITLALLSAMVAGMLLALIPSILKVKLGISEVIVTILLNTAAIYFCSYLASGPFKASNSKIATGTEKLAEGIRFNPIVRSSNLTASIYMAIFITIAVWYFMTKTTGGYEYKMTGLNSNFSKYSGLKNNRIAITSMLISGAICGLVGMFETYLQTRFVENISNEFYFDGMLVAMIMRYNPFGIVFMSIFFAMMKIGSMKMQTRVGISSELILVIQSIIIFFMAAENGITTQLKNRREVKKMKKALKLKAQSKEAN